MDYYGPDLDLWRPARPPVRPFHVCRQRTSELVEQLAAAAARQPSHATSCDDEGVDVDQAALRITLDVIGLVWPPGAACSAVLAQVAAGYCSVKWCGAAGCSAAGHGRTGHCRVALRSTTCCSTLPCIAGPCMHVCAWWLYEPEMSRTVASVQCSGYVQAQARAGC